MAKKLIVCALLHEGRAIIDSFKLKLTDRANNIYSNENIAMIVSGVGKLNSAIATTILIEKYPNPDMIFNIGIAGSTSDKYNIGELVRINKVTDYGLGKSLYPEMIYDFDTLEDEVFCVDFETSDMKLESGLVDMESFGFVYAATKKITREKIVLLKIVSDYLAPHTITKELVLNIMKLRNEKITQILVASS